MIANHCNPALSEQNARGRADDMGSDPAAIQRHTGFGRKTQFADEDADETTGIIRRGSNQNYLSVSPQDGGGVAPGGASHSLYSLRSRTTAAQSMPSDENDGARPAQHRQNPGWKQYLGKFQSIELENKGSVARDHLALGTCCATQG